MGIVKGPQSNVAGADDDDWRCDISQSDACDGRYVHLAAMPSVAQGLAKSCCSVAPERLRIELR